MNIRKLISIIWIYRNFQLNFLILFYSKCLHACEREKNVISFSCSSPDTQRWTITHVGSIVLPTLFQYRQQRVGYQGFQARTYYAPNSWINVGITIGPTCYDRFGRESVGFQGCQCWNSVGYQRTNHRNQMSLLKC